MSLLDYFKMASEHLIPFLFMGLVVALLLRYFAYRSGKLNQAYFNSFSRSVQKMLEDDAEEDGNINDIDDWLDSLMDRVVDHLPDRSLRTTKATKAKEPEAKEEEGPRALRRERLKDYADGKRSVIIAVKQQVDALKSPHPPNYAELTRRVLDQDSQWRTLMNFIPIDRISRMFDIMPGLFIVGGIFGTFMGITSALPKIASIDLNQIDKAGPILNSFVSDVAFSMNTSIAGIACSVIMTVLTAIFPLTSVRNEVKRNMARAFEFMWYEIHGDKESRGDKKIIEQLAKIYEVLADKSTDKKAS